MKYGNKRFRPYTIIFYGTQDELNEILDTYKFRIKHYAYILHDSDVYEEDVYEDDKETLRYSKGEVKKAHFHVLVDFYDTQTQSQVIRLFTTETDKPRVEPVHDRAVQYEYLWHKNDPNKFQYKKSDIVSDKLNYWEKLTIRGDKSSTDEKAIAIIEDLLAGVRTEILLHRYGRDFIMNYSSYHTMKVMIADERSNYKPTLTPEKDKQEEIPLN